MSYKDIFSLPSLIYERIDIDEHVDTNTFIAEKFRLSGEQERAMLSIENDILVQKDTPTSLPMLLAQKLMLDQKTAMAIAVELWGNYFLLFQDFLCPKDTTLSERSGSNGSTVRIDQLITEHGGSLLAFQERAKKLLSPGRQLRSFIREFLSDSLLEGASDVCAGEIVAALVERIATDQSRGQFSDAVHSILLKANLPIDASDHLIDNLEGMVATGTLTKDWALYYRDLASNVLNAVPFAAAGEEKQFSEPIPETRSMKLETQDPETRNLKPEASKASNFKPQASSQDPFLLQRFAQLPEEKKKKFSSPAAVAAWQELEKTYAVKLDEFLMRLALGDFPESDLAFQLKKEFSLSPERTSGLRDSILNFIASGARQSSQPIPETRNMKPETSAQKNPTGNAQKNDQANVSRFTFQAPSKEDYDRIADIIISGNTLTRLDEKLEPRVRQILVTRLKNIRSMVETKEKLMAPVAVGGAGLMNDDADALVRVATDVADKILKGTYEIPDLETRNLKPETQAPETRNLKTEASKAQGFKSQASSSAPTTPILAIEEIDGLPILVAQSPETRNMKPEMSAQKNSAGDVQRNDQTNVSRFTFHVSRAAPTALKDAKPIPIAVRPSFAEASRPKAVADIRPKLIDAVEELRLMTLKDFRRLAEDPQEAIKRINQKIQMLEKESISKKMAAIDAWKENQVSELYRAMASASMTGKKIEGPDALTDAEFDALLDLNELLRT